MAGRRGGRERLRLSRCQSCANVACASSRDDCAAGRKLLFTCAYSNDEEAGPPPLLTPLPSAAAYSHRESLLSLCITNLPFLVHYLPLSRGLPLTGLSLDFLLRVI